MPFSVCIIINQWHNRLPKVLTAAQNSGADELLLGVNGSFNPDTFPELKRFASLRLIRMDWLGYGATKNELAARARHEWILSLDADEMMNETLQTAVKVADLSRPSQLYAVRRINYLGESPLHHGTWGKGKKSMLRLYNRNFTQWNTATVHEQIEVPKHAAVCLLPGAIKHYTAEDYDSFIQKNRHYARLAYQQYRQQKKTIFPGRAFLSAAFNFIKEYIFLRGFLDGGAGWQIAKGNALYTYWKYRGPAHRTPKKK